MSTSTLCRRGSITAIVFAGVATTTTVFGATYNYVNWTSANVAGGTASGTIALAGDAGVNVTFVATTPDGGAGNLYGAQTGGNGTNYWTPASTYEGSQVENAPPTPDILQLSGGQNETYTVNLSEPIVDPIMAIVSLGGGSAITYNFDSPFTIVSQGTDQWGGSSTSLVRLPNDVLQGSEGSGVIQFVGTYSTLSWTVPTPETWHGFTFGILTSAALYDGGGPDGSTIVIGVDGGVVTSGDAGTTGGNDAGGPSDAGIDAGGPSGAGIDAGGPSDAGIDATPEAGAVLDASPTDAETTADAESTEDATLADSGGADVTTSSDAGEGDAGEADAGGSLAGGGSSSCSCRAAGTGGSWDFGAFGALLGSLSLLRRRRSRGR